MSSRPQTLTNLVLTTRSCRREGGRLASEDEFRWGRGAEGDAASRTLLLTTKSWEEAAAAAAGGGVGLGLGHRSRRGRGGASPNEPTTERRREVLFFLAGFGLLQVRGVV